MRRVKKKATRENSSVSTMVSSDEYRRAYDRWKKIGPIKGIAANSRLSREQAHERR